MPMDAQPSDLLVLLEGSFTPLVITLLADNSLFRLVGPATVQGNLHDKGLQRTIYLTCHKRLFREQGDGQLEQLCPA